ncbi:Neurochondrin-domain-containing protein [Xylaria bambusicola]|uniref:Neurochondrin-domain-containing protein n=1 Tax=Xylaria bambusicola TaxID=326684 RepID=UPI002008B2FE|nr:Neurochondrin-domain-containing protein [Xylaria bambusicola]KAI0528025.1 Neurochondrin-domain-containing protein [Xylaria bambusicola]
MEPEVQKVHQLLAAKDDTSRFVGLLLLKTTLDNHASDLQHEQVIELWNSISPRFLDRLIRTGSHPASQQRKQSGDMLDVAVAVIYTFTKLLNDCASNEKFYARIPNLANAVLYSSEETTRRIVDLIHVLVQQAPDQAVGGATCFAHLDVNSWAPLIEIAPQHETVLSIFHWAWINGSATAPVEEMRSKIDKALLLFVSSFKGQLPTSLLDFIALVFENLNPNLRPLDLRWLQPVARLIHDMASNKQTADGRRAYINCAAALLAAYSEKAAKPLFSDDPDTPRPIAYLFIKMVQVDILSTLHLLIPKVNTTEYPSLSRRIAAALDIMTSFVGFLITAADDTDMQKALTPERILKLHEDLIKTIGDVMEYLRDRWDDFLAGSRGIESPQSSGRSIFEDPITPAAVRFVATWLRDDDGEALRSQAAGLIDLFTELYKMNMSSTDVPELRLPILAALEGILQTSDGREAFHNSDLLPHCLYPDLRAILTGQDTALSTGDYIRGSAIVQTFHILVEHDESSRPHPGSVDLLEIIAKCDYKPAKAAAGISDRSYLDFYTDLLELAVALLNGTSRGAPLILQQNIKASLQSLVSEVQQSWSALNDESMTERMAELNFD